MGDVKVASGGEVAETPAMKIMGSSYYAVIFSSRRNGRDEPGYQAMAARMVELAKQQTGYLGVESVRGRDGAGITISYWRSPEDIKSWRRHAEHLVAQKLGREQWYEKYDLKICKIEDEYKKE